MASGTTVTSAAGNRPPVVAEAYRPHRTLSAVRPECLTNTGAREARRYLPGKQELRQSAHLRFGPPYRGSVEMTVSSLSYRSRVFVDGTPFKVQYEGDVDVTLRLGDRLDDITGAVGARQFVDGQRHPVPGRFHLGGPPRDNPFLLDDRELWGQSFRATVPATGSRGRFLALWTVDASRSDPPHWKRDMAQPQRLAAATVSTCLNDGYDLVEAAFLAGLGDGVLVRWALGEMWPPCEFEDEDVSVCVCGDQHFGPL